VARSKEEEERLEQMEQDKRKVKGCLDPLTEQFITFEDTQDLENKINHLYQQLDEDSSGGILVCKDDRVVCTLAHNNPPDLSSSSCPHARTHAHVILR
jgi:hypothetical protein